MKVLILLFLVFVVGCRAQDIGINFFGSSERDYVSFNKNNFSTFNQITVNYFDPTKQTVLYIHGFNDSGTAGGCLQVVNAYLPRKSDWNVACLDWGVVAQSGGPYAVASKIKGVSGEFITILNGLTSLGLNIQRSHFIGYSFGSFQLRFISVALKKVNKEPTHCTHLEPAYGAGMFDWLFLWKQIERATKDDCKLVEIYHTNYGFVGDKLARGDIDVWINGGVTQPGCPVLIDFSMILSNSAAAFNTAACNHKRVLDLYTESVGRNLSNPGFVATKCSSNNHPWNEKNCNISSQYSMGFHGGITAQLFNFSAAPTSFYVKTNANSPYSIN